jgi:hypothetical protein
MSCPYFYPVQPRSQSHGPAHAALPLVDAWDGICRAVPGQTWQPDDATLQPLCNLGYARGACNRFPEGDGPDAVRFTVSRHQNTAIRIYYVIERDHLPFAHGAFEYSAVDGAFAHAPEDATVSRQAQAYVTSYLRRKLEQGA